MCDAVTGVLSHTTKTSLRLWVFKFIDAEDVESFAVCVEGYRPNDETQTVLRNWHSTAITRRITPSLLQSQSGSVYELRGSIDRDLAHQYGYPDELVAMFLNGFPENWKSILKEYFYVVRTTNPLNASHYFSAMFKRRSLSVARGQSMLNFSGSAKDDRRRERLSILPSCTTLPVPIIEEDEEKINSMLNASSVSSKKTSQPTDERNKPSTTRRSLRANGISLPSTTEETPKFNNGGNTRSITRCSSRKNTISQHIAATPRLTDENSKHSITCRSLRKKRISPHATEETPRFTDRNNKHSATRSTPHLRATSTTTEKESKPPDEGNKGSATRRSSREGRISQCAAAGQTAKHTVGTNNRDLVTRSSSRPSGNSYVPAEEPSVPTDRASVDRRKSFPISGITPRAITEKGTDITVSNEPVVPLHFASPKAVVVPETTPHQLPIVQSPDSVDSQSLEHDLSAGPVFEEPHCDQEFSGKESRESDVRATAKHNKLALVPVSSVSFKVPARQLSRGKIDDAVELCQWSIRFAPIGCGGPELGFPKFVLLGNKKGQETQWRTSVIVRVESAEILYTSSTKYRLVGDMDIIDSASAGFPKIFVARFLRGFPPDWRTQITALYNTFFGTLYVSNDLNTDGGKSSFTISFPQSSMESGLRDKFEDSCHDQNSNPLKDGGSSSGEARGKEIRLVCPGETDADHTCVTAVSHRNTNSGSEIRRSRSGRYVHAPLAHWAGQRVRYDGFGNVIGVQDVSTATIHSKGAPETMAISQCYGVSPARPPKQVETFLEAPVLAVDSGPKKMPRQKVLVTYSDSSDEENEEPFSHRIKPFLTEESSSRRCGRQSDSEESEFERELRAERRLILRQARELRRQQANLLEMERRLAFYESKWRKKKYKETLSEHREDRFSLPSKPEDRRHRLIKKVKGDGKQQMRKKLSKYEDEKARYSRMLERQRLEEEWAQEDELLSESDYSDGDVDWREPVRKRRRKQLRRVTEITSSECTSNEDEQSEFERDEHHENRNKLTKKIAAKKEKAWDKAELERLKLALAAIHVKTDSDWEKIARSLGHGRSPDSCKQAAIKRLKWEPSAHCSSSASVQPSELITAKLGTIAFQHQTNEYTRKFMMDGDAQGEDFFKNSETVFNDSMAIPDVTEFFPDDSLLDAMRTPAAAIAERKAPNRRQFLAEAVDDDTPISRRSSAISMITPRDSLQRERQNRYFHHLINKGGCGNMSRMNLSRVGNSTRFEATGARMHEAKVQNFESLHGDLDYVAKMTSKASKRKTALKEDSDEDLELEDEDMEDFENDVFQR